MRKNVWSLCLVMGISLAMTMPALAGTWQEDSVGWYYQNDDGSYQKNGWFQDGDGKWYYFDANGYMLTNTITPDGYQVGSDGAMISNDTSASTGRNDEFPLRGTVGYQPGLEAGSAVLFRNNPEYAQINTFKLTYINSNKVLIYLAGLQPGGDPMTAEEMAVVNAVRDFVNSFDWKNASEYERAAYAAEYVAERCVYKETNIKYDGMNENSVYSVLINGVSVCDGFADAYHLLTRAVGLKSVYISNAGHAWNYVMVDGSWYEVDISSISQIGRTVEYGYSIRGEVEYDLSKPAPEEDINNYLWVEKGLELQYNPEIPSQPLYN